VGFFPFSRTCATLFPPSEPIEFFCSHFSIFSFRFPRTAFFFFRCPIEKVRSLFSEPRARPYASPAFLRPSLRPVRAPCVPISSRAVPLPLRPARPFSGLWFGGFFFSFFFFFFFFFWFFFFLFGGQRQSGAKFPFTLHVNSPGSSFPRHDS